MFVDGVRHDSNCRVCQSKAIKTLYKLHDTPLEDQFLRHEDIDQPLYPLELAMCEACRYIFLPYIVDPDESYSDYLYNSSVTHGLNSHFDQYASELVKQNAVPPGTFAVDLGSNDGSMLASLRKAGLEVLGVEPASAIAKQAYENGLPTINDYFTEDVVNSITAEHGKPGVITANYMYANIDDLVEFTRCVHSLLSEDGIFVIQTGYHPEQMKIGMFDYIYHEHFSYFTLSFLAKFLDRVGLEIIDASIHAPKGGSIRITSQHKGAERKKTPAVETIMQEEARLGVDDPDWYAAFYKDIQQERNRIRSVLEDHKSRGSVIVGFGASHSTTTLIYEFGLAEYLDYIVDDNPEKHGTFSPGAHIPVHPSDLLQEQPADCIVLLAWQHQGSILKKHKSANPSSDWLIPFSGFEFDG